MIWAEVVTADGKVLECSAEQNSDLFWGLRGAGANFGVVTEFEYKLHPVSDVLRGLVPYPLREDVLRFFDEFSSNAPDELTTVGAVLMGPGGNTAFGILACFCGPHDGDDKVLKPLRNFGQLLADLIERRPYVEMQTQLDPTWPPGRFYYNRAHR